MTQKKKSIPTFGTLPRSLPIFPVAKAMLLPRGRLPLNVFEPRYINMVDHALKKNRLIGMIQPRTPSENGQKDNPDHEGKRPLYDIGCMGRLIAFEETLDRRYEIILQGVCRFAIAEEMDLVDGFRVIRPDWSAFKADFQSSEEPAINRERLRKIAPAFFKLNNIQADWDVLEGTTDENLINSLAMGCPFAANEKQALLEAIDLGKRADILIALIEMALIEQSGTGITSQ